MPTFVIKSAQQLTRVFPSNKNWIKAAVKQSLLTLWCSRQLFSNSLEEKVLSAYIMMKIIHTKAEGNPVIWNSWWDRECFLLSWSVFKTRKNCDWSKLFLFWKNNEKLRMRIVCPHQKFHMMNFSSAEYTKFSKDLSCHFIFSS